MIVKIALQYSDAEMMTGYSSKAEFTEKMRATIDKMKDALGYTSAKLEHQTSSPGANMLSTNYIFMWTLES